ncbi:MAG: adenylate/guanylate cyclase domain-containing protein [Oscillospiraceae bacterium]|nr:adenylate/guanylate cyclase domain-containing protein [Oscillospiraceae bacterium]
MSKKNKAAPFIEAAIVFVLSFFIAFSDIFHSFDCLLRDKLYQQPRGINNSIKIIAVDDDTLRELGPFGTWSRGVYADVINKLGDYPAVIAMDIMIFGDMDSEGDMALHDACKNSGRVVSGSYINYSAAYKTDENGDPYIDYHNVASIDQPIIADCAVTGFVNAVPDDDGIVRTAYISEDFEGTEHRSLAAQTYSLYCQRMGLAENIPALDSRGRMQINYAGRPYDYEHISLCRVLDGSVDPRIFTDCIVIVGAYASGLQDQFSVPNSADQMFGAEIHANIVQGLIDGKYPVYANRVFSSLAAAAIACLIYILSRRAKFRFSTPASIAVIIGCFGGGIAAYGAGVTVPVLYAPLCALVSFLVNLGRKYAEEAAEKRKITDAFKKYVAPQVVEEIAKKGGYQIRLGGENRNIAVLFVDIRGFTPMSESLEPEQVVDILNSYLNLTTNAIFKNGGTLDKFIGDATMAVFNAPFDLDDYIYRAVRTAWDIVSGGNAIESKFLEKYGKSVSFGVGVNCGPAVVGNIGCDFRMDYTAIGDTVNTAARLEANAKRGQVLISEYVYEQVKDRVSVEPIGEIPLKGKSKGVFVYSLTALKEEAENDIAKEPVQ